MLIDTHAHLNFSAFKDDLDEVVGRASNAGMKVINVGSQYSTSQRAVELAKKYPGVCYAAIGLHPIHLFELHVDVEEMPFNSRREEYQAEAYRTLAKNPGVVAIGEVGLDYFQIPAGVTKTDFKIKQKWVFLKQLQLAKELALPVILHCRGEKDEMEHAYLDMLHVLKEVDYQRVVIHCYTADFDIAKKFLEFGAMISFTGIITYPKTEKLATVVKRVPLDRIMVETDCPYLAPQIVRGQRNEPRFVQYVAGRIADIKGLPYNEVEEQTTKNALSFFSLK
ncbi:MAG: TatD family hydrolase [Patescibacteria group bacterium]